MTTTTIAEHPGAVRRGGAHAAPRTASSPTVEAVRELSHAALTDLVKVDELERRAFAAGRVWSSTPGGNEGRAGHESRRAEDAPVG